MSSLEATHFERVLKLIKNVVEGTNEDEVRLSDFDVYEDPEGLEEKLTREMYMNSRQSP